MAAKTEIQGLKECRETLQDFSKAMQKNVGKRALHKAGEVIVRATKARAPISDDPHNKTPGSLKAAPRTVDAKPGKRAQVQVAVLVEDPAAVRVEYGSAHNKPPAPFFRPAIDGNKGATLDAFGAALVVEVVKVAERVAKKAAKAA